MRPRPKTFLAFLALFLFPLLVVAGSGYLSGRRAGTFDNHNAEVALVNYRLNRLLNIHEDMLVRYSTSLFELTSEASKKTEPGDQSSKLRKTLTEILNPQMHFVALAAFDQNKRQLFLAETRANELVIKERDFLPGQLKPEDMSWTATKAVRSAPYIGSLRANLLISVPVLAGWRGRLGVVTGEVDLTSLLREAVEFAEVNPHDLSPHPRDIVITNDEGRILYHPNPAFLHQSVPNSIEYAKTKIPGLHIFVSALDQPNAGFPMERFGAATLVLSFLIAIVAAFFLARRWERHRTGIEKVTQGVAAIAHGDLDHRIEALSSDAIRPISDNLNLMTAQLREQIARETEARQFQSFVRLSAMLTHDLKNAIEALSLIVSNMERHFDNEAFRADAMKSLNLATQNLRRLVDRLTNPVTTLSGEYKRPQPVDLVPMLKRVIKLTAVPALGEQQIETNFPDSLLALVDAERIEKVMENLIINAIEAMGESGNLSVAAGDAEKGKVFFSVSDTGPGMSRNFIERQLFRPFATTKKRGVGLGLYTCREVVRANGGAIEVDSRQGAGTTFRVVLPSATIEKV
ncbi:MAG TPA: ATP-binding protein [Pyrinomonadaceae bacterium]|nr:ATP-binding protein [Pyrinomonadaceae bacterium]